MMQSSKGSTSPIAQAFMNNAATQAPTLPQIQAPVSPLSQQGVVPLPQPSGPVFSQKYMGGGDPAPAPQQRRYFGSEHGVPIYGQPIAAQPQSNKKNPWNM